MEVLTLRFADLESQLHEVQEALIEGLGPDSSIFMPGEPEVLLSVGYEGRQVLWLQRRLRDLGEYYGGLDGVFGYASQDAVVHFQQVQGIRVDGIVGQETRGKMYEILARR